MWSSIDKNRHMDLACWSLILVVAFALAVLHATFLYWFMSDSLLSRSCSKCLDDYCALSLFMFWWTFSHFQVKEILEQILKSHAKKISKVLLVAENDKKAQNLSSSLKLETCTVTDDTHGNSFTMCSRCSEPNNIVVFVQFLIMLQHG